MAESTLPDPRRPFEAVATTPIADLSPHLPSPTSTAVRGIVTITWPYNSVRQTFAFILAEPDFRLRMNKGQVRVDFTGRAAKIVGESALASNDEVLLSLDGVAWQQKETNKRQSLPGSESGWTLSFSDHLSLQITRAETGIVDIFHIEKTSGPSREPNHLPPTTTESSTTRIIPSSPPPAAVSSSPIRFPSPIRDPISKKLSDGEFASPAFIKRARMSYGSLFEDGFDIFDDDGGAKGRGRKRTKFGRDSSAWRYTSQSPSPEPPTVSADTADRGVMDEIPTSPLQAKMRDGGASASFGLEISEKRDASPKAQTIDEGCQTMEVDLPATSPIPAPEPEQTTDERCQTMEMDLPATSPISAPEPEPEPASSALHAHELEMPPKTTETLQSGGTDVTEPDVEAPADNKLTDDGTSTVPVPVAAEAEVSQNVPPESLASESTAPEPAQTTVVSDHPHPSFGSPAYPSFEFGSLRPDYAVNPWQATAPPSAPEVLKSSLVAYPAADPFSSSVFGASTSIGQPLPFSTSGDVRAHPEVNIEYTTPADDVENDTTHSVPATSDYPALEGTEDTEDMSVHHDALSDYPVSYLEVAQDNVSQQHVSSTEYDANYTAPPASSSWATINTPSRNHTVSAAESYGTSNGTSPEQALIIDDSDSDDESVSQSAAAYQASLQGRAETHAIYEDVDDEADRDVDQQYSEEETEENGFEGDVGGDYDTRIYEQPADDEDDERDDDLRPHILEPELEEEEYSDEDEEDEADEEEIEETEEEEEEEKIGEIEEQNQEEEEYDEEEESGYEMDYEVPHPGSLPHVQSRPMVIDLISSSEDEGDDDENVEPEPRNQQSHLSPEFEEPLDDEQTRSQHGLSDHGSLEEELDESQAITSNLEEERSERLSVEERSDADDNREQKMEEEKVDALDEVKEVEENSDYDDDGKEQPTDPASLEVGTPPLTPAVPEPERTHMDIASPVASAQILSQGEVSETVFVESNTVIHGQEEESFSNPVTAADGLEMLTRIVENESLANESLANSPSTFTQQTTTQVIVEVSEDQPGSPEPLGDNDAEIRQSNHELDEHPEPSSKHESIDIDPGNDEVNLAALSPAFTEPLETAQENESNDTDLGNGETNLVSPSPVVTEQLESTRGTESLVTDPGTDEVNLIAPSPTSSEHHEPPTAQKIEAPTIGTFSPPLSQSFQSFQSPLEQNSSTAPVQETTFDIESQTAVGQLPTPLETQNTGIALSVGSPFASPTDTQPVDQQVFELQDIEVLPETPDDILQREALMSMDVDVGDEEEVITSEKQQEQEPELSHEEKSPSPALSIESQFDSISPPVDSEQKYQSHRTIIIAESPVATTPYDSLMELDDELQASILEFSQPDDASSDEVSQDKDSDMQSQIAPNEITGESFMEDAEDNMSLVDSTEESHHSDHAQEAVDEAGNQVITEHNEANKMAQTNDVARAPTMPERGQEIQVEIPTNASTWPERSQSLEVEIPSRRVPSTISAQLQRNFIEEEDHHAESETLAQNDPSVHLARAANAAKRLTKSHHSSPVNENRRQTRSFNAHRSPSPDVEDASANLARASFNSQPPKEEDSYSMTAVKLSLARHLRDNLPDCTSLQILRQHLTKSLDVIAVAVMETSEPRRSKTRDFIMSFTVTDQSIGPHAVVEVRIARPHIESLPEVKCGDVVLLRNFKVTSLAKKGFGLQSKKEGSSWAVFDRENEPALIKGAPVEYGKVETDYVDLLREWFSLLDEKARDKLDTVNQEIMEKF